MIIKSSQEQPPKVFMPVELSLTFQTQEEIDRFYAVFNHTVISEFLDPYDKNADRIRANIRDYVSDETNDCWDELDKRIKKNG